MIDYSSLRMYGPGKYTLLVDAFVDRTSLVSEETGDVETTNHFALVDGPFHAFDYDEGEERLTLEEENFLRSIAGAIVETTSDGFTVVLYYQTRAELMRDWADRVERVNAFYEESEDDESPRSLRDEFEYRIFVTDEDDDPEGHFASGDDAADKETVAWIREQAEWNVWAWCVVKVTATHPDIEDLEGVDYLGGCSYNDEADFKTPGGYFADMCDRAADDLEAKLERIRSVLLPEER
jgi:hypothetical protein